METREGLQYGCHNGTALLGDLYLPKGSGSHPVVVAVHGGGWQVGSRDVYRFMGPHLAAHGFAVFSIDDRLTRDGGIATRRLFKIRERRSSGCAAGERTCP